MPKLKLTRRKKLSSAAERCARAIKDSDEFIEHVGNIADRYRRQHALDNAARRSSVRRALRQFHKHAAGLSEWLEAAGNPRGETPESAALAEMGRALHSMTGVLLAESQRVRDWLATSNRQALALLNAPKRAASAEAPPARATAAEALRSTFEYHRLKWSTALSANKQSDAIRLLCAISAAAGDPTLTPAAARELLLPRPQAVDTNSPISLAERRQRRKKA
jgi:hypothetical protein